MDLEKVIKILRENGLPIRLTAKATGIPKSTVHRYLQSQPYIPKVDNPPIGEDYKFYLIHFPFDFKCPGCGLEQNHAWLCSDCGEFIPTECGENVVCARGFNIEEIIKKLPM